MPLIIVLVECGLELIPKQIRNHPAVKKNFSNKIYASQLLDNALHFSAMKPLENYEKRGRPDITHVCLLNALGSPLNKNGNLMIFIHTIHKKIFKINPKIRIARNYNRFKGLIAKLLIDGSIEIQNSKLIEPFLGNLNELIAKFENPEVFLFSSKGKLIDNYQKLFVGDLNKNYFAIVGAFQKSTFSKEISTISEKRFSISHHALDAWTTVSRIISYYELTHGII